MGGKKNSAGGKADPKGDAASAGGLRVVDSGMSLPRVPDAEKAVLAMCLEDPRRGLVALLDGLGADGAEQAFYEPGNKVMWAALQSLFDEGPGDGSGIDLVTLAERLRVMGKLDEVGGAAGLAELVMMDGLGGYSPGMMNHYLGLMVEAWQRRKLWYASERLKKLVFSTPDAGEASGLVKGVLGFERLLGRVRDRLLGTAAGTVGKPGKQSDTVKAIRAARNLERGAPVWVVCPAGPGVDVSAEVGALNGLGARNGGGVAVTLDELEDLWTAHGSGMREAVTGAWVVLVELDSGVSDGDGLPPRLLGGMRLCRDTADTVTVLRVGAVWKDKGSLVKVLAEMRAVVDLDAVGCARELRAAAEMGRLSAAVWYEGYWGLGSKGGVNVYDDLVARRIMARERLVWAGGDFWQWGLADGETGTPGMWNRWRDGDLRAARVVRDVLRLDDRPSEAINQRNVSSVVSLMKSSRFCTADDLNGHDAAWINCRSGMLNGITGELRPHGEGYLSTVQVPLSWDPVAKCERWEQWLAERLPDAEVRAQLQEIFGYCVVPAVNYHKFFFWYGDGGTGKSTAVNVLSWLVGEENVASLRMEELDQGFVRGQMVGKSLYLCPEVTPRSFRHMDMIKAITSGDPIGVDQKYRAPFTFRPRGRMVMTSNVFACTNDVTEGFARRLLQMNWDQVIPDAEKVFGFEEEILKPELPGIFRWAIEGFQRLHARGRFEHTVASQEALRELMRHRSQAGSWVKDAEWVRSTAADEDAVEIHTVTPEDLYRNWREWCDFHDVKPFTDDVGMLVRDACKHWPELRERRWRRWQQGVEGSYRETVYRGLVLTRPAAMEVADDDTDDDTDDDAAAADAEGGLI